MAEKKVQEQLRHFEQICKDTGLKLTHQRLVIYTELLKSLDHPSAESLYKRLEKTLPTLSLDTVYRTLATFEKLVITSYSIHYTKLYDGRMRVRPLPGGFGRSRSPRGPDR